ncbi:phage gpG-like protein [Arthrobacter sp. B2I5]|uniref:phage virion morphogenesis protein n=1 Tax=Arthrobacter sp. B2I5 TaxID=3042266 RepID=UPI0027828D38|nr:phage virion morphogenesis protein [Arthrobacter sp. B2I5]MDQ0825421.1 phage gpG-like protein [Arthrobacter sp. B2I5]
MSFEVAFTFDGQEQMVNRLRSTARGVKDLSESMSTIGLYLSHLYAGEVFASRGGVIGEPWARLSPDYAAEKARKWPGRPPLMRTGKMQSNFRFESDANSARMYNPTPYFKYHQSSDPRSSNLPRRVMMKIDDMRRREVLRIIQAEINRKVNA